MRGVWINLKSSLWFIPALSVLFSAGLAIGMVQLDAALGVELSAFSPEFFGLGADGSRSILATIAQSVITIAGVSFSITIVALSLAANQYTPRVLRNFMRDRGNQLVLGGLVGIFTYCIIVLRTIQGGEKPFVPPISVILALGLSIIAIGLFIYFVHHVATSIQASSIISSVAFETHEVIRKMFPTEPEQNTLEPEVPEGTVWHSIETPTTGYLQTVGVDALASIAEKEGVLVEILTPVGDFVVESTPLLNGTWHKKPSASTIAKVQRCFNIQPYRTIEQDPAFGMRQIVDIAVKALSPGINDPTTAITCLDYLGSILNVMAERHMPPRCINNGSRVCLIMHPPNFESLVNLAFNEIRQNCQKQAVVYQAMLGALLNIVKGREINSQRRQVLAKHTRLILKVAEASALLPEDFRCVESQGQKVLLAFES